MSTCKDVATLFSYMSTVKYPLENVTLKSPAASAGRVIRLTGLTAFFKPELLKCQRGHQDNTIHDTLTDTNLFAVCFLTTSCY